MLVKWKPMPTLINTRSIFDELFNDTMAPNFTPSFEPKIDLKEEKNEYEITAELAGLDKDDFSLVIENDVLTLKGEKKYTHDKSDDNYHFSERQFGNFCRSFRLADEIKRESISANFKNGILKIKLPKAKKAKPKEIPIKIS